MRKLMAISLAVLLGGLPLRLDVSASNSNSLKSTGRPMSKPTLKFNWSSVRVGETVATGNLRSQGGCTFHRIEWRTEHVAGKQRFLTVRSDNKCRLVVVEKGEREVSTRLGVADSSTKIRFYNPSQPNRIDLKP